MSSSGGVSIARTAIRGVNRFYNPPAMRRMQQEAQLQQQLREEKQQQRGEGEGEVDKERKAVARTRKSQGKSRKRVVSAGSEVSVDSSESSGSGRVQVQREESNLDRFLEHTTPVVQARLLPMRSRKELKPHESESNSYFVLEDLWESFAEWSAYGAGVPLHMDGSDSTVQYYVPFLSGIQLYEVDPSNKTGGVDKLPNNGKTLQSELDSSVSELNSVSLEDQPVAGSLSSEESNPQGRLLFEYLEYERPYGRESLASKVK